MTGRKEKTNVQEIASMDQMIKNLNAITEDVLKAKKNGDEDKSMAARQKHITILQQMAGYQRRTASGAEEEEIVDLFEALIVLDKETIKLSQLHKRAIRIEKTYEDSGVSITDLLPRMISNYEDILSVHEQTKFAHEKILGHIKNHGKKSQDIMDKIFLMEHLRREDVRVSLFEMIEIMKAEAADRISRLKSLESHNATLRGGLDTHKMDIEVENAFSGYSAIQNHGDGYIFMVILQTIGVYSGEIEYASQEEKILHERLRELYKKYPDVKYAFVGKLLGKIIKR